MGDPVTINIRHLSRGLGIQLAQVQAVLELLDEGNTIPFITRYRKDQTGGLDEEKIRLIQDRLEKLRLLAERKQTILRSIESQGKLTEELDKRIRSANTAKRLEDLYLPYKPKKQTLAQLARSRGLETLANEIIQQSPSCSDLDGRAADFVNSDRGVPTAAEALLGAGHILAERISENVELRQQLREIMQRSGRIVSCRAGSDEKPGEAAPAAKPGKPSPAASGEVSAAPAVPVTSESTEPAEERAVAEAATEPTAPTAEVAPATASEAESVESEALPQDAQAMVSEIASPDSDESSEVSSAEAVESDVPSEPADNSEEDQPGSGMGGGPDVPEEGSSSSEQSEPVPGAKTPTDTESTASEPSQEGPGSSEAASEASSVEASPAPEIAPADPSPSEPPVPETPPGPETSSTESSTAKTAATGPPTTASPTSEAAGPGASADDASPSKTPAAGTPTSSPPSRSKPRRKSSRKSTADRKAERKRQKKQKAEEKKQKAFSDYFSYSEDLRKIPPHRVLAINRGERGKVLRVRIESDQEAMLKVVDELSVPGDHPHAEFLKGCARDALTRLILPSLEREARRELTERAEGHAVGVFAKNLRNLLLQPPVHDRRVLAVDPGFKSGCKLVALDQFGNVLAQAVIFLIGKAERKAEAERTVRELMERFKLTVVAIGNGTACREAEDFFGRFWARLRRGPIGRM